MRVAVVSDIHGNRRAFEAVLRDLQQMSPDAVLHGGDLAANGAHPAEIIDRIRSLGWLGVRGNTDEMLWAPECLPQVAARHPKLGPLVFAFQEMIPATQAEIGEERIGWLKTLPHHRTLENIAILHASPSDLWRAPLEKASDNDLSEAFASLQCSVVVYGHIHRPFVRDLQTMKVANTGSVSLSYDGDPRASYVVIDGDKIAVRRVEYDNVSEADDILHSGIPHADWLSQIMRSGRFHAPETFQKD